MLGESFRYDIRCLNEPALQLEFLVLTFVKLVDTNSCSTRETVGKHRKLMTRD